MSDQYIIIEKESYHPGCFGITFIIGIGIAIIYGIYRLIKTFFEWLQSINPYSIAIFFCVLALLAGFIFLGIWLYKYYRYKSILQNLDNIDSDLRNVEEAYEGQNKSLQQQIDNHLKNYKALPEQINNYPELGIAKEDDTFWSLYIAGLEAMSKALYSGVFVFQIRIKRNELFHPKISNCSAPANKKSLKCRL